MTALIIPFPPRAAAPVVLPIPCDPTTERMARDILEHIRDFRITSTAAVAAFLADRDWEEHEIARHLHAAWRVARAARGVPARA
ncbi:hypothetical protein ACTZWW_04315 [Salinarimonas sp. NSM]|uniref:hypothetical protein n=1 Tax=Salinarimonas sp. NSM TaxID=3458003 RepID=UPI0040373B7F